MQGPDVHAFYTSDQANNRMSAESRIESALQSGSIKQVLFQPSGRKLWTVIGKDNEHWTDPELGFCSCKDFYFTTLSGGQSCYHLKSVEKAIKENRFVTVEFDDSEYVQFLQALAEDVALLGRG
jgi:predicted nucleic acid-binding Zn finger protein